MTTSFTFTAKLSGATTIASAVNWADGERHRGALSFAAGATSKTITVVVAGDTTYEANETSP